MKGGERFDQLIKYQFLQKDSTSSGMGLKCIAMQTKPNWTELTQYMYQYGDFGGDKDELSRLVL